ncbi:hypothetical protein CRYUN_Cryun40dG0063200 [Craigia yunnanensis]
MENGYPCNQWTCSIIIRGLCKSGNLSSAVDMRKEINENGSIKQNVVCYNTIIDGFCKERCMDKALIIYQDMVDRSIEPDVVTFNSLIHGLCSIG